jgi:hypothetical protein
MYSAFLSLFLFSYFPLILFSLMHSSILHLFSAFGFNSFPFVAVMFFLRHIQKAQFRIKFIVQETINIQTVLLIFPFQ